MSTPKNNSLNDVDNAHLVELRKAYKGVLVTYKIRSKGQRLDKQAKVLDVICRVDGQNRPIFLQLDTGNGQPTYCKIEDCSVTDLKRVPDHKRRLLKKYPQVQVCSIESRVASTVSPRELNKYLDALMTDGDAKTRLSNLKNIQMKERAALVLNNIEASLPDLQTQIDAERGSYQTALLKLLSFLKRAIKAHKQNDLTEFWYCVCEAHLLCRQIDSALIKPEITKKLESKRVHIDNVKKLNNARADSSNKGKVIEAFRKAVGDKVSPLQLVGVVTKMKIHNAKTGKPYSNRQIRKIGREEGFVKNKKKK